MIKAFNHLMSVAIVTLLRIADHSILKKFAGIVVMGNDLHVTKMERFIKNVVPM